MGVFGFFEAGMCREKNTVDTLSHNLIILVATFVIFWFVGFGLMYGNGNPLIGLSGFGTELLNSNSFDILTKKAVPLAVAFAFAMSFADTPATLIAGSGAERIRFAAITVFTVLISGFIFPIVGHWIVGGGWLANLITPMYDTGAGFIHLCGGACALAVTLLLGPRMKRFKGEETGAFAVSSMPLVFLGAFIIWLGFFGFNAGFAMSVSKSVGLVIANTALAGGAGAVTTMMGSWALTGKAELRATIVGLLTANVAITSSCSIVMPWAAAIIGVLAGAVTLSSMRFWVWLKIDDPTEYLTMNLVGGFMGVIAVGVFASPEILQAYGGTSLPKVGLIYGAADQLLTQLLGAGAIFTFALTGTAIAGFALRSADLLRVPRDIEEEGADESTHGEKAKSEDEEAEESRQPQP